MFSSISAKITVIIVVFAFGLTLGGVGGYRYSEGRAAVEYKEAVTEQISQANQATQADTQQAVTQAQERVVYRTVVKYVMQKGISDASIKGIPACDRDDESYQLLHDAIDAANNQAPPRGLPDRMPPDSQANRKDGSGD